jgi:hypothetical protein
MTLRCLALLVLLTSGCAAHYQHVVERALPAAEGLSCAGYLVWNQEPVRDVFLVINGSGILSNAFVHPSFDGIVRHLPIAYSTYDKPGIRAPWGNPAAVRSDDASFQRYTLGHGVACATAALGWARARFGPSVRLHLRGHSEGTLVALYAYDELLDRDPETARSIATLVLSGLALDPFGDILARQLTVLPDRDRIKKALAACDFRVLKQRLGLSCSYVEDAERRPSGRAVFERLAARAPAARFYVFHGTGDWNTPVAPVRALEAWNTAQGHLRIDFHYYQGGHRGNDAVRGEIARLLMSIASE